MVLMLSGFISYSCTHCTKRPPGARDWTAAWKWSRVNRFDTPVIQGFDGSEITTS